MKIILAITLWILLLPAHAITKCQDAEGKWHYGDIAVEACKNSKITILNDRGFIKDEQYPPKTPGQLKAEAEEQALLDAEEAIKKAEVEERLRILSIYETEDDIDRQRDNQLNSVNSNLDVHNAYLKAMEARVLRYEAKSKEAKNQRIRENYQAKIKAAQDRIRDSKIERDALVVQKQEIVRKFVKEKKLYQALKSSE